MIFKGPFQPKPFYDSVVSCLCDFENIELDHLTWRLRSALAATVIPVWISLQPREECMGMDMSILFFLNGCTCACTG